MRKQVKYYNALASVAAQFRKYFRGQDGQIYLFNIRSKKDPTGYEQIRDWVRQQWPRKVSKLLRKQAFERAFRDEDDSELEEMQPMSDDSEVILPKRRRIVRSDSIRMLTETNRSPSEPTDDGSDTDH